MCKHSLSVFNISVTNFYFPCSPEADNKFYFLLLKTQKLNELQARGATYVLTHAVEHFGVELPSKLPKLWEAIFEPLTKYILPKDSGKNAYE